MNIKNIKVLSISVLGLMIASSSAFAGSKTLLLDFSAGFQAGWSTLKIYSDRTVRHTERVCCPLRNVVQKEPPLTPREFKELTALIDGVAGNQGPVVSKKNTSLALGFKNGTLTVYSEGNAIEVENIARYTVNHGDLRYMKNDAARALENWIYDHKFVLNEMAVF